MLFKHPMRLTIASQEDRFVWEFVLEADIMGVLYDATLQGGINHLDDAKCIEQCREVYSRQYRLRTGMNTYYKGFFLRYMLHYNSRDFHQCKSSSLRRDLFWIFILIGTKLIF